MADPDQQLKVQTSRHHVQLVGDTSGLDVSLTHRHVETGLDLVTLKLKAKTPCVPPPLAVHWMHPDIDIQSRWHPGARRDRSVHPDWDSGIDTSMTVLAPVASLFNLDGINRLTFACSETIRPITLRAGVFEETAEFRCGVELFQPGRHHDPITEYALDIWIDTRASRFSQAVEAVREWWAAMDVHRPMAVPDIARRPFYSTWYSFHQEMTPDAIVEQCRLASHLGCRAIIVDDGWQTVDANRGYAYTGDWQPERLPEMRELVERVHETGMKFLLWYATPFVGKHSAAFKRFQHQQLTMLDSAGAAVLDPRFPEVRSFLVETFATALRAWNLDGLKLDFVDFFDPMKGGGAKEGMDIPTVPEATQRLFTEISEALLAIRPDVMIEFRQPYIGPVMRRFANMFRSNDCPNDAVTNRINVLDLRLTCGRTVVHGDMFMWNPEEPAELAALQLLNVLFSVPQVSVRLDQIPDAHVQMLRFWLGFWNDHRDVLLDAEMTLHQPEAFYPAVLARNAEKLVIAAYQDVVIPLPETLPGQVYLVNATSRERLVLDIANELGTRRARVFNCRGQAIREVTLELSPGIHALTIPPAGLLTVSH